MIRVRFPDGVLLQATFAASAPVSAVLAWVEGALREPGHPFELAIARGAPLSEMNLSLEHAELAPAALLNFRPTQQGSMDPPYLGAALMASCQLMGDEQIPRGYGGDAPAGPMGADDGPGGASAARARQQNKAPAWMRPQ